MRKTQWRNHNVMLLSAHQSEQNGKDWSYRVSGKDLELGWRCRTSRAAIWGCGQLHRGAGGPGARRCGSRGFGQVSHPLALLSNTNNNYSIYFTKLLGGSTEIMSNCFKDFEYQC